MLKTIEQQNNKIISYFKNFKLYTFNLPRIKRGGVTLIEILVILSIFLIITFITIISFSKIRDSEALDKSVLQIVSVMEDARSLTLGSSDDSVYGVYIETTQVTLFKGASYSAGDPNNKIFVLNKGVNISNIVLSDGGSSVVFSRLTGKSNQTGTTTITSLADQNKQKFIFIQKTGLINITQ